MKKLAVITTHPIQYNAPFFKMLHTRGLIEIKIFYTWSQTETGEKYDPGFKRDVKWDIPLLEGYPYSFVRNISVAPGSHHFKGMDNPTLVKEITEWGADAVLVYGWSFKSHLAALRHFKKKIPVLFRGDSTLKDPVPFYKAIMRKIVLKRIYRNVDHALYAGTENKKYFLAAGLDEEQLVFMPHAIENSRFQMNDLHAEKAQAIRAELDIPQDALVFLFAAKLEPKKQPDLLARVFAATNNKNSYLIIAGSGPMQDQLFAEFGIHKNIRFPGFQNQQQMPALYASCDVFILPSKGPGETWGLAINEAMAAGKAIIASDACGAATDLVRNGENGFIFAKDDLTALQNAMEYFMINPGFSGTAGQHSLQMIEAYNFEQDCTAVEETILSACKTDSDT